MKFKTWLKEHDACEEAVQWVGNRTVAQAWAECEKPRWMLWLLVRTAGRPGWPDKELFVRFAVWCARRALDRELDAPPEAETAVKAAERWLANPTDENARAAEAAALTAEAAAGKIVWVAAKAAAWAAWAAAGAAARAAWAAWAAARAVGAAAREADWAAETAVWAAGAARAAERRAQADWLRDNVKLGEIS